MARKAARCVIPSSSPPVVSNGHSGKGAPLQQKTSDVAPQGVHFHAKYATNEAQHSNLARTIN